MHDFIHSAGTLLSEEQRTVANRAAIFTALRDDGVLRAIVGYSGSGDSGGTEGVRFEMPDGGTLTEIAMAPQYRQSSQWRDGAWQTTVSLEDKPLEDALTDFAMDAVDQHYGGWEDNDGASGEVVFDATDGTIVIEHRAYFTDSEYSEVRL